MTASIEDVADIAGAIAWPLVALVAVLLLRPALRAALESGMLQSIGLGPLTLGFAGPTAYEPTTGAAPLIDPQTLVDGRSWNLPEESPLRTLASELEGPAADYVVIDLGDGQRWLASRLYLFGQLLHASREMQAFVFVHRVNPERVFLGSAEVESVLWRMAQRYPHLGNTYAEAYLEWKDRAAGREPLDATLRLGGDAAVDIAFGFLRRLQQVEGPGGPGWTKVGPKDAGFWEHSDWLDVSSVQRLLGPALNASRVDGSTHPSDDEIARAVIAARGKFVAIVDEDRKFERLVDRTELVDRTAERCLKNSDVRGAPEDRSAG